MKIKRQEKILELISKYDIETQEDLAELLRQSGFVTTQATVSRDIKELRLIKITDENGLESIGLKVVGDVSISKLLKHLCQTLPSIMVPSKITIVDKLDKTPSGKLKR